MASVGAAGRTGSGVLHFAASARTEFGSPGPLHMSDLGPATPPPGTNDDLRPPRRLDPLPRDAPTKKRTRKKKPAKVPSVEEEEGRVEGTQAADSSLLGAGEMTQLRARLDPLYRPPPPSVPPLDLSGLPATPSPPPQDPADQESPKKRKRTTKRGVSHKNAPTSSSPPLKQRRVAREMAEREITSSRESVHSSGYSDGAPLSVSSRHSIDQDSRLRERLIAMAAFPTGEPTSGTPAENENGHRSSLRNKRRRRRRRMDEEEGERMEERGIDGERVVEVREREGEGLTDRGEAEGETEDHNTSEQGPDAEGTLQPGMRHLPALPVEAREGMTAAEQLAYSTGHRPSGMERSSDPANAPTELQLLVNSDDVIEEDEELPPSLPPTLTTSHQHYQASKPKDVVFVERRDGRGFVAQRQGQQTGSTSDVERAGVFDREWSSADFALMIHGATQRVALIAHGLVAGISLWECIVINVLSRGEGRHLDLLQHYHPLSLPAHILSVLLLSIVMVSLLDRFDMARLDRHCLLDFVRAPLQILITTASLMVFLALIVTLSTAAIDERVFLYPHQPSLWLDLLDPINSTSSSSLDPLPTTHTQGAIVYTPGSNPTSSLLASWLALAVVRALCCCLSWLAVGWVTSYDRLNDYLQGMTENLITEAQTAT